MIMQSVFLQIVAAQEGWRLARMVVNRGDTYWTDTIQLAVEIVISTNDAQYQVPREPNI